MTKNQLVAIIASQLLAVVSVGAYLVVESDKQAAQPYPTFADLPEPPAAPAPPGNEDVSATLPASAGAARLATSSELDLEYDENDPEWEDSFFEEEL